MPAVSELHSEQAGVPFLEAVLSSAPSCDMARSTTWPVNNINSALLTKNPINTELSLIFLQQNLNFELLSNLNYFLQLPETKKTPGSNFFIL